MLRRGKGTDQNDIYQKRNSISEVYFIFFKLIIMYSEYKNEI